MRTPLHPITREAVVQAEKLIGLDFSDAKIDQALAGLKEQLDNFESMRRFPLSNSVPPAMQFNPLPVGFKFETQRRKFKGSSPARVELPAYRDDLAFCSVGELAALIELFADIENSDGEAPVGERMRGKGAGDAAADDRYTHVLDSR